VVKPKTIFMQFKEWEQYFLANKGHFDHLDWNDTRLLTNEERKVITASIQQFQRGEHSEGKHFMSFARSMNDESYLDTVKVFIREEQDHALVLGRFMDIQDIPRIKKDWLDNVFRWLRKLAGLEGTVTVLLTAEIIAIDYYKALRNATRSVLLEQICEQILVDEEMHLRFQSHALKTLYARKPVLLLFLSGLLHKVLMAGTIVMVWLHHRKVLAAGGYRFFSFCNAAWQEFRKCERMINGKEKATPFFKKTSYATS
jgi:hypothetical protein